MKRNLKQIPKEEIARQESFLDIVKEGWADEFEKKNERKPAYIINTYGCQMNERDSEHLKGMLSRAGLISCESNDQADIILFNTCCVREHAEHKVFGNVGALAKLKALKPNLIIGVCGCMMQQQEVAKDLFRRFPFVDMIFGTHALYAFGELFYNTVNSSERIFDIRQSDGEIAENLPTLREEGISAYVTIMYGCDNFCSYCIVPYVRGRERSRAIEDIKKEISELLKSGCKEITLLGQNVNSYGKDIEGASFPMLLRELNEMEGLGRIRFMTSHPKDLSDELIDAMAECDKVCKHIHLPVQSGSDEILQRMNRNYNREKYFDIIEKLRARIPNVEITTDIIVGFPGESQKDFEDTLDLIERVGFAAAYTFMYSKRMGTPAAKMDEQIDQQLKKDRLYRLNELQAQMCKKNNEKHIGKIFRVLIEGADNREKMQGFGKADNFKMVYFPCDDIKIGEYANVKITNSRSNSLLGELI